MVAPPSSFSIPPPLLGGANKKKKCRTHQSSRAKVCLYANVTRGFSYVSIAAGHTGPWDWECVPLICLGLSDRSNWYNNQLTEYFSSSKPLLFPPTSSSSVATSLCSRCGICWKKKDKKLGQAERGTVEKGQNAGTHAFSHSLNSEGEIQMRVFGAHGPNAFLPSPYIHHRLRFAFQIPFLPHWRYDIFVLIALYSYLYAPGRGWDTHRHTPHVHIGSVSCSTMSHLVEGGFLSSYTT